MNRADNAASTKREALATAADGDNAAANRQLMYDQGPAQKLVDRHTALHYPFFCNFGSAVLEINEGVFCPTLTKASPLLLDSVTFESGQRVLDVFAGSGAFGINAALHGATAVTVDISPCAVACATRNAILNGVEDKVDVREGTMQHCVSPGETFDVIVANPPLLPGRQTDELSASIFDPGLHATVDFIREVAGHLKPDGHCYLVTSDVIERCGHDVDRLCIESGLVSCLVQKLDVGYEVYRVHEIARGDIDDYGPRLEMLS